jgi:hypothetical protein
MIRLGDHDDRTRDHRVTRVRGSGCFSAQPECGPGLTPSVTLRRAAELTVTVGPVTPGTLRPARRPALAGPPGDPVTARIRGLRSVISLENIHGKDSLLVPGHGPAIPTPASARARKAITVVPLMTRHGPRTDTSQTAPGPRREPAQGGRPVGTRRCHRPPGPCDAASRSVATTTAPCGDDEA